MALLQSAVDMARQYYNELKQRQATATSVVQRPQYNKGGLINNPQVRAAVKPVLNNVARSVNYFQNQVPKIQQAAQVAQTSFNNYQRQVAVNKKQPFFNNTGNNPIQWAGKVVQDVKKRGPFEGLQDLSYPILENPYIEPIEEPLVGNIRVANFRAGRPNPLINNLLGQTDNAMRGVPYNWNRDFKQPIKQAVGRVGQNALQGANAVGKTIGNQPVLSLPKIPGLPQPQSPTILQAAQTFGKITGGTPDTILSSLLKGQSQNIPALNKKQLQQTAQALKSGDPSMVMGSIEGAGANGKNLPQEIRGVLAAGKNIKERGFISSVKGASNTPQGVKDIISGSYVVKSNKQLKSDALKLIRSDPTRAEQLATNPRNATDVQIGHELINHFGSVGNFDKAGQITEGMANSGTEFGQAIQAFSQYDKTTPAGALKYAQSKIGEYNRRNPNAKLSVTSDQVKGIFDKARSVQEMPQGRERNIASHELMQTVNNLIPSTIADKAITVWKAGLLTSLRTTERNLVGNTIHGVAEAAKDIPGAITDKLLSLKTGQRTLTPTLQGALGGAKQGIQSAKDIIKTGYDPEEAISKYDVRHVTWGNGSVEQGLKKYTDIVFRSLGAQDKPFWNSAYARSLHDQAGAEAINAGRQGDKGFIENLVKKPNEQMLINATKDANTATFHDKTMLSQIANNFKQAASKNEYTKVASEVIAPFTGVPSSIAKQLVAYSPLGLVNGIKNAGKVLVKDVPNLQRQASQEVGRGVIGTGLLGIGAYLSSKGLITGQPKDPKEAQQWQLEGKQANSVLIGGKWRAIGSIGPENLIALAGAKANEELKKPDASLGSYAANVGKDFLGQTFLQGVQQPLAAVNDPTRYGPSYIGNQAASVVPNIVKDTAKAFDPNQRESNNVQDYLTNAIPGLRNHNIPKRDNLGNEIPQEPSGIGAYTDLFNSKTPISNPVVDELARLNNAGQNATPSKLTKQQTINGAKMSLTSKQLDALESQSGAQTKQALETLFQSSGYQSLSDEEKATAANNVIASIRKSVKTNIDLNNPSTTPDSTMSKAVTQQAVGSQEKQATITRISDMLLDANVDATKKTQIVQALQKNKTLFNQVKKEVKDRQSGLTVSDKAIRSLSTSQKATYIISKIRSAQSTDEKLALYRSWAAKGIINKNVIQAMKAQQSL